MSLTVSPIDQRPATLPVAGSFTDLKLQAPTLAALARIGITQPTPIQATALPALIAGRDVIGQARTGSGKTLAFVIPAVQLVDPAKRAVQVLVLTPTRELAVQVEGVFAQIAEGRRISTALIFGGRAIGSQVSALRRGAQIVVGTPGRVLDLLNRGELKLDQLRFLVLDEADEMLDRGFAPDVERILARTPASRQTALFSATVPDWVSVTSEKHLRRPVQVSVDPNPTDAPAIDHIAFDLPDENKLLPLRELLDRRGEGSVIVFGRTKHGVKKLARQLEMDGYPVGALQGNLSQNARDRVMEQFRSGELQILAATNVAARGLDITSVDLVINLELPESPELLTHRIGRTGRMGREGRAITLLAPSDAAKWRDLERGLTRRIPRLPWQGADVALTLDATSIPAMTAHPAPRRADAVRPRARVETPAHPRVTTPERAAISRPRPASSPARARRDEHPGVVNMIWADGTPIGGAPVRAAAQSQPQQPRPQRNAAQRTAIVCSSCGNHAEVPFRPDTSRPVYCNDCHAERRSRRPQGARRG